MILVFVGFIVYTSIYQPSEDQRGAIRKQRELDFAGPPTFVYKTKGDYYNFVPVFFVRR